MQLSESPNTIIVEARGARRRTPRSARLDPLAEAGCPTRSPPVGSNKRYSAHYDALMDARILRTVADGKSPETLSEAELDLGTQERTVPPRARACRAWVRYAGVPVLVDAELCAWTPRAAAIRWRVDDDRVDRAWVWASAVRPSVDVGGAS